MSWRTFNHLPSDVADKIVDFVPSINNIENIFVALRWSKELSRTGAILATILEAYLSRNQITLKEYNLRWLLETNFPISSLDISEHYHSKNLWLLSVIPHLRQNSQSILHLRVHGHKNILIDDKIIRVVSEQYQNILVTLKITGNHHFSTEGIKILTSGFPHLSTIDFSGCQLIDDDALVSISQHYFSLNEISVHGCEAVTDRGLLSLVSSRITFVDVVGTRVTDGGILNFVRGCPKLADLGSYAVSDDLIHKICLTIDEHHHLSALTGNGNIADFTDTGLSILSTPPDDQLDDLPRDFIGRPNLSKIRLHSCQDITDVGLHRLGGQSGYLGCSHLTDVTLSDCQFITDDGIDALCYGCRKIRTLKIIRCDYISDEALMSVCCYCVELTSISFYGCGGIGSSEDHSLSDLARLPSLVYANLVGTYACYWGVFGLLRQLSNETNVRWTEEELEVVLDETIFGLDEEDDRNFPTPSFVKISYHPFL